MCLFVSKNIRPFIMYHQVNDYLQLEEILESKNEIWSNFKNINFRNKEKTGSKKNFCFLKSDNNKNFTGNNIIYPKNFMIINPNNYLFSSISSKIKIKCLLTLDLIFL